MRLLATFSSINEYARNPEKAGSEAIRNVRKKGVALKALKEKRKKKTCRM